MTKKEYQEIENYMLSQMEDSAHDKNHIYRVLYAALDIANCIESKESAGNPKQSNSSLDFDVLIASCLLHDIGRKQQFLNKNVCHAAAGGAMAYEYLLSRNWNEAKSSHVKDCIITHRFRSENPPQTVEAKIVFDSDKLEAVGAMGIARTLIYQGHVDARLYHTDEDGYIITEKKQQTHASSFFEEYNYKLKNIYNAFFTERALEIAKTRQKTAIDFYNGLHTEITVNYDNGIKYLNF